MSRKSAPGAITVLLFLIAITSCGGDESLPFGLEAQVVAPADRATVMVFAPDGRMFFGEQYSGNIRVLSADGQLQEAPFATIAVADWLALDWGLTGLALDPDFESNHFVYAFYTELVSDGTAAPEATQAVVLGRPKIVRFTEAAGVGTELTVIADQFPETVPTKEGFNANASIDFGPDGFLYASLGDYDTQQAGPTQDLSSPVGKMLRMNKTDGSAAPGNPHAAQPNADPRVFARGFREPFDFAFHPQTGAIYGSDNTTNTCEEINVIAAGLNYGWPDVGGFPYNDCTAGGQVQAIHRLAKEGLQPGDFNSLVAISSLAFLKADLYPLIGDSLLLCEFDTKVMRRLVLSGPELNQVTASDVLVKDCARDVSVSPDGTIYYSTDTDIRKLVTKPAEG